MNREVNAAISREWKRRMLIILAVVAGSGAWFMFDGLVAYPRQNVRAEIYFRMRKEFGEGTPELKKAWEDLCIEKGWSFDAPKKIYSQGDLTTQVVLGGLGLLGGVAVLLHYLRSLPTTTRLREGKILLPDGRTIPIEAVRALSKKRWENKGIADLAYEKPDGSMGRFLLDDYKYAGAVDIVEEVEGLLPPEAGGKAGVPAPDK